MELFGKLGIDVKLLIAQLVNFFVLLYVLKRFAYKPVLKILEDRKRSIEKGLKDTKMAEKKLRETEEAEKRILAQARQEAKALFAQAEESAQAMRTSIMENARAEANHMMENVKKDIEQEKQKMLDEARSELAGLVVVAVKKISNIKLDEKADTELIEQFLKNGEKI